MIYLILLALTTLASAFLQYRIWMKSRSIVLVLPTLVIYYWSLMGGWAVTIDLLTNNALENYGFHYYAYFEKLFPIQLNESYFFSLCMFSFFLLAYQCSVLWMLRKVVSDELTQTENAPSLNHWVILSAACSLAVVSYFFIRAQIAEAIENHESLYIYLSHHSGKYYSLYQICKSSALFLALFGVALLLSQQDGKRFRGNYSPSIVIAYALVLFLLLTYSALIGSRNDLLFAFLFSISFYIVNARKVSVGRVGLQLGGLATLIVLIEMTRALPILDYLGLSTGPGIPSDQVAQKLSFFSSVLSLLASNEMFAGHMSMYGAVYYDVPFTFGGSFNYLVHSMIPRIFEVARPIDSYQHYTAAINYTDVQGFTINHATGWYVNFGVVGVFVGAVLIGLLAGYAFCLQVKTNQSNRFVYILHSILLLCVASFFPALIRTGPEGFKALFFEAIVIPTLLIALVYRISIFSSNTKRMEKPFVTSNSNNGN